MSLTLAEQSSSTLPSCPTPPRPSLEPVFPDVADFTGGSSSGRGRAAAAAPGPADSRPLRSLESDWNPLKGEPESEVESEVGSEVGSEVARSGSPFWLLVGINTVPRPGQEGYLLQVLEELSSQIDGAVALLNFRIVFIFVFFVGKIIICECWKASFFCFCFV